MREILLKLWFIKISRKTIKGIKDIVEKNSI